MRTLLLIFAFSISTFSIEAPSRLLQTTPLPDVTCPSYCFECIRNPADNSKTICHACHQRIIDAQGQCTIPSPTPNCRTFKPYGCSTCVDNLMREFEIYGSDPNDRKFMNCVSMPSRFDQKCLLADKSPQDREGKPFCLITKQPNLIVKGKATIIESMTDPAKKIADCHQYAEVADASAPGGLKTTCWICNPGYYHDVDNEKCLAYDDNFRGCTNVKAGVCTGCNSFTEKYYNSKIVAKNGKDHITCSLQPDRTKSASGSKRLVALFATVSGILALNLL